MSFCVDRLVIKTLSLPLFVQAGETASSQNKWLLVNVQNTQEFQCQVLNRDVWSNKKVQDIVLRNFVFKQVRTDKIR